MRNRSKVSTIVSVRPQVPGVSLLILILLLAGAPLTGLAQELPEPQPGPQRPISIPAGKEIILPNGLRLVVVERKGNPLVTVRLSFRKGAESEAVDKAGLADMTVSMFPKGTKKMSASEIASGIEFLGGSLDAGASWTNSDVTLGIPSYNLEKAFAIFSDVVNGPTFDAKEIDLYRSQALDELTSSLRQPSFLASYVASAYTFGEHPVGGTPRSLNAITRDDLIAFRQELVKPEIATVVFVGDVTFAKALRLVSASFGSWKNRGTDFRPAPQSPEPQAQEGIVGRILVVDLPNTGQASVGFAKRVRYGRTNMSSMTDRVSDPNFFSGQVLNAILGAGYSSRLNQEIRIKRGLSYGANSSISWRALNSNLIARAQTKNESAAEVAELTVAEVRRLTKEAVDAPEMKARQSVLIGSFGQNLETNAGVAATLGGLYSTGLGYKEMDHYVMSIQGVTAQQVQDVARKFLNRGDLIIVGDYSVFAKDLASRFSGVPIKVVKAAELDLSQLK